MSLLSEELIASSYEQHIEHFYMLTQHAGSERWPRDLAGNNLGGGTRDDRQLAARNIMLTSAVVTSVAAEQHRFC
jgi:hypothetical protein